MMSPFSGTHGKEDLNRDTRTAFAWGSSRRQSPEARRSHKPSCQEALVVRKHFLPVRESQSSSDLCPQSEKDSSKSYVLDCSAIF